MLPLLLEMLAVERILAVENLLDAQVPEVKPLTSLCALYEEELELVLELVKVLVREAVESDADSDGQWLSRLLLPSSRAM